LEGFFSIKIRNFKLLKMPKLINFRFAEGLYFSNYDKTELIRSSKIFFLCFRTASLGGSGLSVHMLVLLILGYKTEEENTEGKNTQNEEKTQRLKRKRSVG